MPVFTKKQMQDLEDYLDEGKGAEKLSKINVIWITATLCLFGWLGLECFHQGLVIQLKIFGDGFHSSALHSYFWGGRAVGGSECSEYASSCPLWEPLADCESQTPANIDWPYKSLVMGHTIMGPWYALRVIIDSIHVFGACAVAWYGTVMLVSGGSRAVSRWKKAVMKQLFMTVTSLLFTGVIMFLLRNNEDRGFPSTNLAPSMSGASEIQPPEFKLFHEIGRVSYFIAFSGGFFNQMGNGVIHYVCPPKVMVFAIGFCLVMEVFATIVFSVNLFTTNWLWYPWPSQAQDLELLSLYPVMDLLNAYALYHAWYKNKEYDWDGHRSFNITGFFFICITVVLYFMFIDFGIMVNRPVLLWEKLLLPVPGLVLFIIFALIPHLKRLMALSKAREASNFNYESFAPLADGERA